MHINAGGRPVNLKNLHGKGFDMGDEFNKDLCNERHKNVELMFGKIDKNIESLFGRLNWFYVIAIITLVGVVASFLK